MARPLTSHTASSTAAVHAMPFSPTSTATITRGPAAANGASIPAADGGWMKSNVLPDRFTPYSDCPRHSRTPARYTFP
jgi:hypothetical protein